MRERVGRHHRRPTAEADHEPARRTCWRASGSAPRSPEWAEASGAASLATEPMMGGGFFLQFASNESYRVEVVLRSGTRLGFNPVAQTKLSRDVSYAS